jgi:hypothetical protein
MSFRFMLQPAVAMLLGIRDGKNDAKAGAPPFIFDLIFHPENRQRDFSSAMKSLVKPIIIATVLDLIAQYLIFQHVRFIPGLIVGTFVMGLPYSLARGITNRIITARKNSLAEKVET